MYVSMTFVLCSSDWFVIWLSNIAFIFIDNPLGSSNRLTSLLRLRYQAKIDRSSMLSEKTMTAYEEFRIIREMTIARFLQHGKQKDILFHLILHFFLELTVFTLLSHNGMRSFIFLRCLYSILNTCNLSAR